MVIAPVRVESPDLVALVALHTHGAAEAQMRQIARDRDRGFLETIRRQTASRVREVRCG